MPPRLTFFLVLGVFLLLSIYANAAYIPIRNKSSPTVAITLKKGKLEGISDSAYSQDYFLGIPYARPPIGNLRFRRPQPVDAWNDTRKAQKYGSWCYGVSLGLIGFSQNNTGSMSEDCLTINIIRPAHTRREAKLPVAVWIHGGAFLEGSAADQRYNGSFLVRESMAMSTPIIFVSFNYRLGIFGLMAGPVLEKSGDTNIAIHDQQMALAWIQENISKFGGDPDNVTIFGESAGAASVGFLLLANGGENTGLFHAAIAQSGGPYAYGSYSTAAERSQQFENTLQQGNCTAATDSLSCLRRIPAEVVNSFSSNANLNPMIDGTLIEDFSSKQLAEGAFQKVPLLIGTNRNEGSTFLRRLNPASISTESDFLSMVRGFSPGTIPNGTLRRWSDEYQIEVDKASVGGIGTVSKNPGPQLGALYGKSTLWLGDYLFTAGRRFANQMWAKHGTPTYSYLFDAVPAYLDPKLDGVAHFADVCFAFGNVDGVGYLESPFGISSSQQAGELRHLAKVMSRMWISFIVHKTPNHHGVPGVVHWPSYSMKSPTNIVLSATSNISTTPDTWRKEELHTFIDLASILRR